jgi:xanthine dehydrogenase large subunit
MTSRCSRRSLLRRTRRCLGDRRDRGSGPPRRGLVRVDYDVLPAILSIEEAIAAAASSPRRSAATRRRRGRAARAPHRLEGELRIGGQEHFYLETNAALAYRDHDGGLMVHSSTQHPSETQEIVARVLGLPKHAVVVQCLRMGGAFGGKEVQANAVGRGGRSRGDRRSAGPVRVRLTRRQDMVLTGKRHPFLARFRVGFEADGALRAVAIELFSDGGWSLDLSFPVLGRAMFHADNCYHVPHMDVVGRVCRTHHVSHTAVPRLRRPAGDARDRGDRRSRRAGPRSAAASRRGAQLLPRGRHDALRPGCAASGAHRAHLVRAAGVASFEARWADVAAFNAASRTSSAGWR